MCVRAEVKESVTGGSSRLFVAIFSYGLRISSVVLDFLVVDPTMTSPSHQCSLRILGAPRRGCTVQCPSRCRNLGVGVIYCDLERECDLHFLSEKMKWDLGLAVPYSLDSHRDWVVVLVRLTVPGMGWLLEGGARHSSLPSLFLTHCLLSLARSPLLTVAVFSCLLEFMSAWSPGEPVFF